MKGCEMMPVEPKSLEFFDNTSHGTRFVKYCRVKKAEREGVPARSRRPCRARKMIEKMDCGNYRTVIFLVILTSVTCYLDIDSLLTCIVEIL